MIIDPLLLAALVLVCAAAGMAAVGILFCVWALARRLDRLEKEIEAEVDPETDS
jgi:hypothetical protein